jgi:uncharacterized paraquat-inducible protein A
VGGWQCVATRGDPGTAEPPLGANPRMGQSPLGGEPQTATVVGCPEVPAVVRWRVIQMQEIHCWEKTRCGATLTDGAEPPRGKEHPKATARLLLGDA